MTFEEAVKEVAEALATNRNGAYPIAVRLQVTFGHNADKLMAAAMASEEQEPESAPAPALADVDFPSAEQLETQLLKAIQEQYDTPIGKNTYTLAHCFVQLMVEDRDRILQMLGALEYPQ